MPVLIRRVNGEIETLLFWCPGCEAAMSFRVGPGQPWNWNRNMLKPSFWPSLKTVPDFCHLVIGDGMIQFCADSKHKLAGTTVPMVNWNEILEEGKVNQKSKPGDEGWEEAVAYVMSNGYSRTAAEEIVAREGIALILADKKLLKSPEPIVAPSLAAGEGQGRAHKDECGDVGATGAHGAIGSNAK